MDFEVTDTQGRCDLVFVTLIDERTAEMTAGSPEGYPTHRCAIFARRQLIENDPGPSGTEYVVAAFFSDRALQDYGPDDWFDAKVMSRFDRLDEARIAFAEYGPSYLKGERLTWSMFRKL